MTLDQLGQQLEYGGAGPYWEATPHPLSYMDDRYKLMQAFERCVERDGGTAIADLPLERLHLDWNVMERYGRVDSGNARMRSLETVVIDRSTWRPLWLPPSMP